MSTQGATGLQSGCNLLHSSDTFVNHTVVFRKILDLLVSKGHDRNINRTQDTFCLSLCTIGWVRLLVGFAGGAWRFSASCPHYQQTLKKRETKKWPLLFMVLFPVACLYVVPAGGGVREPWNYGPRPLLAGEQFVVCVLLCIFALSELHSWRM